MMARMVKSAITTFHASPVASGVGACGACTGAGEGAGGVMGCLQTMLQRSSQFCGGGRGRSERASAPTGRARTHRQRLHRLCDAAVDVRAVLVAHGVLAALVLAVVLRSDRAAQQRQRERERQRAGHGRQAGRTPVACARAAVRGVGGGGRAQPGRELDK